jgi:cytochrome c oxidase assembly factor CtaG/cytochrome c2
MLKPVPAIEAFGLWIMLTGTALAHSGHDPQHATLAWNVEWWVLLSLAVPVLLYALGIRRMRRRLGSNRIISAIEMVAFAGGMLVLFIALVSPIDTAAEQLFSVHMVQHLLLLFVAPPLLVFSRPAVVFLWAFRSRPRHIIGRLWISSGLRRIVRVLMNPQLVWVLFSGLFIFWHFPKPYAWALENEGIHAIEHLCFFISALMFWTIVIEPSGRRRLSYPGTLLHVGTTAALGSLPGALLVLATRPLYPEHAAGAATWGLTTMQDQQLAGVIMWVPAGLAYVIAMLWLFARWLREAGDDNLRRVLNLRTGAAPVLALGIALAACSGSSNAQSSAVGGAGDPQRGRELIRQYGCGSCHTIPGINGADALVGPPLDRMGRRIYIAGMLRNTPSNLATWVQFPQQVVPGNAMPNMGLTRTQAEDIAAYLSSLR